MTEVRGDHAATRSEVMSLRRAVETLQPVGERTAVLVTRVEQIEHSVGRVEEKFDRKLDRIETLIAEERKTRETIREREREEAKEVETARKVEQATERRWRLALAVTMMLGFFAACVSIAVAVIG